MAIAVLDPADYPAELQGAEQTPGTVIYEVTPDGATLEDPVVITRRLDASNFGLNEGQVPVIGVLSHDSAGTYEVLDDLAIRREADDVFVTASTTHFSDVIYVREDLVIEPLILEIPTELVAELDADFDYGLGPGSTVLEVGGLECGSEDGSLRVLRQLTDDDIASIQALVDELLPPEIELDVPVDVSCTDVDPLFLPASFDVRTFVAVEHGSEDSDILFGLDPEPFPPGFDPELGLGLDGDCDGPDGFDPILNAPTPFELIDGQLSSRQKIFTFGCYFAVLTPAPEEPVAIDAETFDELLALFPEGVWVPDDSEDVGIIEVTEVEVIFADGFESGDTTAWSNTVP